MRARLPRVIGTSLATVAVLVAGTLQFAAASASADTGATVTGTVLSQSAGGAPLTAGDVFLQSRDFSQDYNADIDASGSFSFSAVAPGSYDLQVSAWNRAGENNLSPYFLGAASAAAETPIVVTGTGAVTLPAITVPPGATISGHVTFPAGHLGGGVFASALSRTPGVNSSAGATTDAAGNYTLAGLWPAQYELGFVDDAYPATLTPTYWHGSSSTGLVRVKAGQNVVNKNVTMEVGGLLAGVITDSAGQPVQNAYVSITPSGGTSVAASTDTHADGSYSFGDAFGPLAPGTYDLQVLPDDWTGTTSSNWASSWYGNTAFESNSTPIVVAGSQTTIANMQVGIGGSIAGRVTDTSGNAVQAIVTAFAIDPSTGTSEVIGEQESDTDGTYVLAHLPPANYELQYSTAEETSDYRLANEYWPGTVEESDATSIALATGESLTGYDIALSPLPISTHSPLGDLASVSAAAGVVTATGWAIDPDIADTDQVTMSVDGIDVGSGDGDEESDWYADQPTPVAPAAYAAYGPDHGFSVSSPAVAPGKHLVCVTALDIGGSKAPDTSLGCQTVVVHTGSPVGEFETATGGPNGVATVTGWAIDPDTLGRVRVEVNIDGSKAGSLDATVTTSDIPADDIGYGADHGFAGELPGLAPGKHRICLTAINRGPTANDVTLGCKTVKIPGGSPVGSFAAAVAHKGGTIDLSGWALDPDTTSPVTIRVRLDGSQYENAVAGGTLSHPLADYPGYGTAHAIATTLTGISAGSHLVCIIAVNQGPAADNTSLGCQTVTVPKG